MADLLIRNINEQVKRQIEERARSNRRSLSDEAKDLLEAAILRPTENRRLGTIMSKLLPPEFRGEDLIFEADHPVRLPPNFE